MAGLTDLLGSLLQSSLASRAPDRMGNALGTGSGASLDEIIGGIGQVLGGAGGGSAGGGLGNILSGLADNKAVLGGLGALAGAIMGGGGKAASGAVGGGALAMLASLAVAALQKAGQAPAQMPNALLAAQTPQQQAASEADALVIIKAMINAAKADGAISPQEMQKITGQFSQDNLRAEETQLFQAEAGKPMDTQALVAAAKGRPELAAQIYAASVLVIDKTPPETAYLRDLAARLGLPPQAIGHIEQSLGV
jgi:uncharacterized membrane protein YebE (DUF533 family)